VRLRHRNDRLGVIKVERGGAATAVGGKPQRPVLAYCVTLYITAPDTPRGIKNVHRIRGNMVSSSSKV